MESLNLKDTEKKALDRREIRTKAQLRRFFPYKYIDYSSIRPMSIDLDGQDVAIQGKLLDATLKPVGSKDFMTTAKILAFGTRENYYINCAWFHNAWIYKILKGYKDQNVYVFGKANYNEKYNNFNMVNAEIHPVDNDKLSVRTVYSSMKGFDDKRLRTTIKAVLAEEETEYVPEEILKHVNMMTEDEAIKTLHLAPSMEKINQAQTKILFDDMLYFATRIEEDNIQSPKGTIYQTHKRQCMNKYIEMLPYTLTNAQRETIEALHEIAKDSRRINALVQGDVGCGKTTVAIAMLILMAENGYQSALMAPTVELAQQHYKEIKEVCDKLGIVCTFYGGGLTTKQQNAIKCDVYFGNPSIIVGTQGILNLEYKNLALVVADEEHKYGVEQREKLIKAGVHSITMSATPIPRSIATTIYGENKQVFVINELPSNRLPIKTFHYTSEKEDAIKKGVEIELKKGHQIYVVCPLIEESEKLTDIRNVNDLYDYYEKSFPNYKVAKLTGSTKKADVENIMADYKANKINILVATSIIEVGISVPNATVIAIYNAERFGIAELHQLRGRVGRGSLQSYCILHSDKEGNPRIEKMLETTDGFEIAKADLMQRGMGDILGKEQSGFNLYLEQAIKYPNKYAQCKQFAKEMIEKSDYRKFLAEYELRH